MRRVRHAQPATGERPTDILVRRKVLREPPAAPLNLLPARNCMPQAEPHSIRLRGPWQYEPLARTRLTADGTIQPLDNGLLPPPGRIHLPADWGQTLGADFRGRVRYIRRFGCPRGLDASEVVQLVIGQLDAWGTVQLNGKPLVTIPAGQLDTRQAHREEFRATFRGCGRRTSNA